MEIESLQKPVLPSDIAVVLKKCVNNRHVYYPIWNNHTSDGTYSYTTPSDWLERPRLRPQRNVLMPGCSVSPEVQLWIMSPTQFQLSDSLLWSDYQIEIAKNRFYNCLLYDGINKQRNVVIATQYDEGEHSRYYFYLQTLYLHSYITIPRQRKRAFWHGDGVLASLMLEESRNRFIYSAIKKKGYKVAIKDFVTLYIGSRGKCRRIAQKYIPMLFIKIVSVGENEYAGITDSGTFYFLWLGKKSKIHYAEQKILVKPHLFKDIAANSCSQSMQADTKKIAFLTQQGEIYMTDIYAFKNPTLLYVATAVSPENIERLYYKDGKISVVYPSQTHVWDDNFEILYACTLLKKEK